MKLEDHIKTQEFFKNLQNDLRYSKKISEYKNINNTIKKYDNTDEKHKKNNPND